MKNIRWIALAIAIVLLFSMGAFAEEGDIQLESVRDVKIEAAEDEMEQDASQWWNVLLLGGDSRDLQKYDRTDTMIILSINRDESRMKMTSIMRDTWVQMSAKKTEKINAANVYGGPERAVKVVNENFGTDIEHYVLINMNSLVELIDMIGGVTIEVSESERAYTNKYAKSYLKEIAKYEGQTQLEESGLVHLNGLLAVAYLRIRNSDSDFVRVMRQQKVLLAAAEQAQEMDVNALMELADDVFERIETNMTGDQLKEIAMAGLVTEIEDVEQFRVPVDGTFSEKTIKGAWGIDANFEKNRVRLKKFIYG